MIEPLRTAFDFDVQAAPPDARPQILLGERLMLQESEWLHMTIGPWLAPARLATGTRAVEYLLLGPPSHDEAGLAAAISGEVSAFAASLRRVDKAILELDGALQGQPEVSLVTSLLSLRLLLGLRLPRSNSSQAFHLRGDRLQLTDWGLESGIPVSHLLMELRSDRSSYFETLRETLNKKHRVSASKSFAGIEPADHLPPLNLPYSRPETRPPLGRRYHDGGGAFEPRPLSPYSESSRKSRPEDEEVSATTPIARWRPLLKTILTNLIVLLLLATVVILFRRFIW